MSGMDVTGTLSIDTAPFNSNMTEAAAVAERSNEQIIRVVNEQRGSWLQLAANAVPAIAQITSAVAGLAGTVVVVNHQKAILSSLSSSWSTAGAAVLRYGGIAARVAGTLIPQWRLAATVIGGSILAYKVATSAIVGDAAKAARSQLDLTKAFGKLGESLNKLGTAAKRPFHDMASATGEFLQNFNPIPAIVNAVGQQIESWANTAAKAVNYAAETVTYYGDSATAVALAITSASGTSASAYYAEGVALRALAEESAKVIAIQEAHSAGYKKLGDYQKDALAAAERAEELAAVATMKTTEEIDAKWRAVQQLNNELVRTGQATAGSEAHAKALFNAMAAQKEGVKSGRIEEKEKSQKDDPVAAMIANAQQQLTALKEGEVEAGVAAAKAKNASVEQLAVIRSILEEKSALKAANKAEEEAAKEAKQQAEEQSRIAKSAANKIAELKDEYDLLTRSATKSDVAIQKALRDGMSSDAAFEIGDLVKKNEAAELAKKRAQEKIHNKAAGFGSTDAARIVLSGLGKPPKDNKEKIASESLNVEKMLLAEVKKQGIGGNQLLMAGNITA